MPLANEDRLRESVKITRTPQDKGWQSTIKISMYDNGVVSVNNVPLNVPLNPNPGQGLDVHGQADASRTRSNRG